MASKEAFLKLLSQYASDEAAESPPTLSLPIASNGVQPLPAEEDASSFRAAAVMAPAPPRRVGLGLLKAMHTKSTRAASSNLQAASPSTGPQRFTAVESYKPLSSGGFMDDNQAEMDRSRCLRVGGIVCVRKRLGEEALPPTDPPAASTFSSTASSAGPLLHKKFRGESAMGSDEKLFGRVQGTQLWNSLGEVTRSDSKNLYVEIVFLSGERGKFNLCEVRPAGFMEQKLFRKWQADPSSRPVTVLRNTTDPSAVATAAGTSPPPSAWWALPKLLVRIVSPQAGVEWLGQKAFIESITRKEQRVRLRRKEVNGGNEAILDVVGLEHIETVVPRVGERGILVLGLRRGELVEVLERRRNATTKDLETVVVKQVGAHSTENQPFEVKPEEICLLQPK